MKRKDIEQWHKNSLKDQNGYVLFFMNSIKDKLTVNDRQCFYIISKYFTDAVEFARFNIPCSDYFFQMGEYYHGKVPKDKVILNSLILNCYYRSKSYYFFKIKSIDTAIEFIDHALYINNSLKDSIPVLIFDSISHYQNMIKILIDQNKILEANNIVFEILKFLLDGKPKLENFKNSYKYIDDDNFTRFKQFFINTFLFNYMILNPKFNVSLNEFLEFYNKNINDLNVEEPISLFLQVYTTKSSLLADSYIMKYSSYFHGIPTTIINDTILI